jgi:hypothetical protein
MSPIGRHVHHTCCTHQPTNMSPTAHANTQIPARLQTPTPIESAAFGAGLCAAGRVRSRVGCDPNGERAGRRAACRLTTGS